MAGITLSSMTPKPQIHPESWVVWQLFIGVWLLISTIAFMLYDLLGDHMVLPVSATGIRTYYLAK